MNNNDIPIYISDGGVVMCYSTACDGHTFESIGRRTNLADLIDEVRRHVSEDHDED